MKKKYLLLMMSTIWGVLNISAQSWTTVGSTGQSFGDVINPIVSFDATGTPYLAYYDNALQAVRAKKFVGGSWLSIDSGLLATAWSYIGTVDFAVSHNSEPYIVADGDFTAGGLTVFKFANGVWDSVGRTKIGSSSGASIAIDNNNVPYVAAGKNGYCTVIKYNGALWDTVGSANIAFGNPYLAVDPANVPYLLYVDSTNKCSVKKFDGTNWVNVGAQQFSAPVGYPPSIAIDNSGTPYIAYSRDTSNGFNHWVLTVMKFNGSSWVNVGNPYFKSGIMYTSSSLVIDNSGAPTIVYRESEFNGGAIGKLAVMKYNGSSWIYVGNPFFSSTITWQGSIARNYNGDFYVAYADGFVDSKVTIQKFGTISGLQDREENIPLLFYPNPATDLLTINLEGYQAELINIYNIDGKLITEINRPATNCIDIRNLNCGVYIAEIKTGDILKRVKWMKI